MLRLAIDARAERIWTAQLPNDPDPTPIVCDDGALDAMRVVDALWELPGWVESGWLEFDLDVSKAPVDVGEEMPF